MSASQEKRSPQKPDLPRLDSEFSSLQNCEKINFCHLNHSIHAISLQQPHLSNTTRVFIKREIGVGSGYSSSGPAVKAVLSVQMAPVKSLVRELDPTTKSSHAQTKDPHA